MVRSAGLDARNKKRARRDGAAARGGWETHVALVSLETRIGEHHPDAAFVVAATIVIIAVVMVAI